MKKIIIAIVFIGSVATSFAEKSFTDVAALNIFKVLMNDASNTLWQKKDHYNEKCFLFNGQEISAYYRAGRLVGLSCTLIDAKDLPKEILCEISKKYNHHQIAHVLIFIDSKGHSSYYAGVQSKKNYTVLKVSEMCRLHVIQRMRIN